MANWSAEVLKSGAQTVRSIGMVAAAAANMRRARVHDVLMGSDATHTDGSFVYQLIRTTTLGTASGVTPVADDPVDTALTGGSMVVRDTFTTGNDPTFSGVAMKSFPLNHRNSFRWVAAPGKELVIPATANNGITLALSATSALAFRGSVSYEEL